MMAFQNEGDGVLRYGRGRYGEHEIDAQAWFQLARFFISLLRTAALGQSTRVVRFIQTMGVDASRIPPPATGLALELLPVHERAPLLKAAWRLLTCKPEVFARTAESVGARDTIARKADPAPPAVALAIWQWDVDQQRGCRSPRAASGVVKPRSRQSVERAWARFKRRHDLS